LALPQLQEFLLTLCIDNDSGGMLLKYRFYSISSSEESFAHLYRFIFNGFWAADFGLLHAARKTTERFRGSQVCSSSVGAF
jgi:hypothetical protein